MSDKYHLVIGIDLGTTYSAVSVHNRFEEEAEIIPNPESVDSQGRLKSETTPSVVSLDPRTQKAIVGWPAKRNIGDAENTIIEIKREMGEVFTDELLDKFHARGIPEAGGNVGDPIRVHFNGEWYLPQEISAFTLMKMKAVAEAHIGEPIRDAVITVPAYFTEKQKKATEEAAYLAGLYPRQILGEPTAAAICYGVDRLEAERKVYLVYDLGGGTFDVSVISVEESRISVLATSGDPRLGGGDFDDAIVTWAVQELREKFQLDASGDREKLARIKAHAEQAKKDLSALNTVTMTLIDVWPQQPPSLEMSREKFEELIEPLLNKSITNVDAALNQAESKMGLRRDDLDAILLVGGSTKIPRVKALLLSYFQQDESFVSTGLNPDEVVARGAATVALKFSPSPGEFDIAKRPDSSLINTEMEDDMDWELITEHSLGIGVQNNLVRRIIDQGTSIPVSLREGGFTNAGPTDYVEVPVYQGEGEYAYENTLIGTLRIGPMEPKPEGTHQFEVTFSLDDNGLLSMTVHHLNEGKNYQAQFQQKTGVGGADALAARRAKLLKIYGAPEPSGTGAVPVAPVGTPVQARPQGATAPPAQPVAPEGTIAPPGQPVAAQGTVVPPGQPVTPQGAVAPPGQPVARTYTSDPSQGQPAAVSPVGVPVHQAARANLPQAPVGQDLPQPGSPQLGAQQPCTQAGAPETQSVSPTGTVPTDAPTSTILEPTVPVPAEFKSVVRRSQKLLLNGGPETLRAAFDHFVELLNSGVDGEQLEDAGDDLENVYHDSR